MFKRIMWVGVGAAVGVLIVRKIAKAKQSMAPSGVAERLSDAGVEAKGTFQQFWSEVSDARREKEAELMAAFERGENLAPLLRDGDEYDE